MGTAITIVEKRGLSETDRADIRALQERCYAADGIRVKLNWGMMNHRNPEQVRDFCAYRDGELVGYVPLDGFGEKYEITGIVRPGCRREGIFTALYEAARDEARQAQANPLLLVNYRASGSGNGVVKALGLTYHISEYRMEADAAHLPALPTSYLKFVNVDDSNLEELASMLTINFGGSPWNSVESLRSERGREDSRYYLATRDGVTVGHISAVAESGKGRAYIRAVGILPQHRNRGYGRQMLSALVQILLAEGYTHFELDVETENSNALTIYQSCGFRETNVYDYYLVPLTDA